MSAFVETVLREPALARVHDELRTLVRSSIRITAACEECLAKPVGASKLGGVPDLPPGLAWPVGRLEYPEDAPGLELRAYSGALLPADRKIAFPFVAQFRMEDLKPHDANNLLPQTGMLYFFLNDVAYSVRNHGTPQDCRVVWYEGALDDLQPAAPPRPIPAEAEFTACSLTFMSEATLPQVETCYVGDRASSEGRLVLTEDEWDVYSSHRYELRDNDRVHQMLGHWDAVQPYPLQFGYWTLARAYPDEDWDLDRLAPEQRQSELDDTRLLLQLSDEMNHMWYGRGGRLFFFIRARDLARRDFSRVMVVSQ